jgi:hypothetical protein
MGVYKSAYILNLSGNSFGITAFCAFKRHMFQHMGNAMFIWPFIPTAN